MNKLINIIKIILVIGCVVLSYKLRIKDYDKVPFPGESLDEYSYSWVGMSLIEHGYPVGVSGLKGYKDQDLKYVNVDRIYQSASGRGTPLYISHPWFDHPPLIGLITGGFAYIKGARVFEEASTFLIRKPMVAIGTVSVLLVFILGYINFGYVRGVAAAFIYASSPLIVVSSRMIQAENGLIPTFLMVLICISLYIKSKKRIYLISSAVFAGTAMLFKLSGISIAMTVLIYLYFEKRDLKTWINEMKLFLPITVSIASLYLIYGFIINREVFVNIFVTNMNRFYGIGAAAFYNLIVQSKITGTKTLSDIWPMIGWICFMGLLAKRKLGSSDRLMATYIICYLITYIVMGSEAYGWYALPFWPILFLIIARVITGKSAKFTTTGLMLSLLIIGFEVEKLINYQVLNMYSKYWKYGLALLMLLVAVRMINKENKISRLGYIWGMWFVMAVLIWLNIQLNARITVDTWYFAT